MTATILVLIALVAILAIGRISKDANLGGSLLVTLALSIAVGIGIKNYTSKQGIDINAKIENVSINQSPMQLYYPQVTEDSISLAGIAGKDSNWFVSNKRDIPTTVTNHVLSEVRGPTETIDSS